MSADAMPARLPLNLQDLLRQRAVEGRTLMVLGVPGGQTRPYKVPALEAGLIEVTLPHAPRSSKRRYRLTGKGSRHRRQA